MKLLQYKTNLKKLIILTFRESFSLKTWLTNKTDFQKQKKNIIKTKNNHHRNHHDDYIYVT